MFITLLKERYKNWFGLFHSREYLVFLAVILLTSSAYANPVLENVSAGHVSISQSPNVTTINQSSQNAILNWQSFNIGQQQATHFIQPTGGIALNRISPLDGASQIYGVLTATGRIILINPAGIFFGPNSYVNVGGMLATTSNITDANFLNGNYQFASVPGYSGSIINEGTLIAADHGLIALVGSNVTNNGMIQANLGHVVLASGAAYTISFDGNDLLNFAITKPAQNPNVTNNGSLFANGGEILVTAAAAQGTLDNVINMNGVAQAKSVYQQNGDIVISGDPNGGVVNVAANLNASGKNQNQTGGNVSITGYDILLNSPTIIDVSGNAGGGNITIGRNSSGQLANATVIMPNVSLLANAINSGNGGSIETSGAYLDINNIDVDTTSPNGNMGSWLLDPNSNLTISTGTSSNVSGSSPFEPSANTSNAVLNVTTLQNALAGGNVTVETTANGYASGSGNIIVANNVAWTAATQLTLDSINDIMINAGISAVNGSLALEAGSATDTITTSSAGTINVANFNLVKGLWSQVMNPLPAFTVTNNFEINGGTMGSANTNAEFLRALSGTGTGPYLINDVYGLQGIGSNATTLGYSFELANNINADSTLYWNSGAGFVPIGNSSSPYTSVFNGENFTINGLAIYLPNLSSYVGLFGFNTGTLKNVALTNVNITGDDYVGGLAGENEGTITDTSSSGSVIGTAYGFYTGGLVGYNNSGSISNSSSAGTVTAQPSYTVVGGLVGYNSDYNNTAAGTITNSYSTASVLAGNTSTYIGGLVGANQQINSFGASITDSYSTGPVTAEFNSSYIGGLVGWNNDSINHSYSTSPVSVEFGSTDVGGFIGENEVSSPGTGNLLDNFSTGAVTAEINTTNVGGFAGYNNADITDNYSTGLVTIGNGSSNIGGFVGLNDTGGNIAGSFWDTNTSDQVNGWGTNNGTAVIKGGCFTGTCTINPGTNSSNPGSPVDLSSLTTYTNASWNITASSGGATPVADAWFIVNGSTRPLLVADWSTTITTPYQLELMNAALGADYTLTNNINLTNLSSAADIWGGTGFVPIGTASTPFTGQLNGEGYAIFNLAIDATTTGSGGNTDIGLFPVLSSTAEISDLGLINASITATNGISGAGTTAIGTLAGINNGMITSSFATGTVTSAATTNNVYAGGLVGENTSTGSIGTSYGASTVSASGSNTSDVYIGDLAGLNQGPISNSYSYGSVSSTNTGTTDIGGLAGDNTSTITDSYSSGLVTPPGSGTINKGGLLGANSGSITNSFWDSQTSGQSTSAGSSGAAGYKSMLTSQMMSLANFETGSTFISGTGWNITSSPSATSTPPADTWFIFNGSTRPMLESELSSNIDTAHGLQLIGSTLGGSFTLAANISLSGITNPADVWGDDSAGFVPIGTSTQSFTGLLNGNDYTISGLSIGTTSATNVGLFGYTSGATLENLVLSSLDITPNSSTSIGGLVGTTSGATLISDVTVASGSIIVGSGTGTGIIGGLVGLNGASSTITGSSADVTVSGKDDLGGLVGENQGEISDTSATGNVTGGSGTADLIGGLVGYNSGGTITGSEAYGNVSDTVAGSNVGGFVGLQDTSGTISSSFAAGNASDPNTASGGAVGGFAGEINTSTLANDYAIGSVTGSNSVGGLVGLSKGGAISNSYSTGPVSGATDTGGFIGLNSDLGGTFGTITNSFWDTDTSGQANGYGANTSSDGSAITALNGGCFSGTCAISPGANSSNSGSPVDLSALATYPASWSITSTPSSSAAPPADTWFIFAGQSLPLLVSEWNTNITNAHQLQLMGIALGNNYTLENNINLTSNMNDASDIWGTDVNTATGAGWVPIGTTSYPFSGNFNANNDTINGLYINQVNNYSGLFGVSEGDISNINLTNASITEDAETTQWVGGLIGQMTGGTVYDANISSSSIYGGINVQLFGGLVGEMLSDSYVLNSSSAVTITAGVNSAFIGGLVGDSFNASNVIGDSSSSSTINAADTAIGGLVGVNQGLIINSFNSGPVTSAVGGFEVGGLVGWNEGPIQNSFNIGPVYAAYSGQYIGGLVGYNSNNISNSYNSGPVTTASSNYDVGGLAGYNEGTISNSYSIGAITITGDASQYIGGLTGGNEGTITDSYSTGLVATGYDATDTGGLAGLNNGTITNSFWDTQTSGQTTSAGAPSAGYEGMTTSQMENLANFETGSSFISGTGWNITSTPSTTANPPSFTWFIFNGETRPILLSEWSSSIASIQNLQIAGSTLGANYSLASNINASGTSNAADIWGTSTTSGSGFVPIGSLADPYTGTFNGQNYVISNLYISTPSQNDVGLFGDIGSTGTVENIVLNDPTITGAQVVGGAVGINNGNMSGIYTEGGTVTGTTDVGGLAGENNGGDILSSYNGASVTGSMNLGGITGLNTDNGDILNVYNIGTITALADSSNIGGLVGLLNSGDISTSYNSGIVTAGAGSAGVGGFVGTIDGGLVSDDFWDTQTSTQVNGVGTQSGGTISNLLGGCFTGSCASGTADLSALATYLDEDWNITATPSTTAAPPDETWFIINGETRPLLLSEWDSSISTPHQLQLAASTLGADYTLSANLTLTALSNTADIWGGNGFAPIGSATKPFSGIFNGLNNTISNLTINMSAATDVGLIAQNSGVIENLGLLNADITGLNTVGGIAGENTGSILNDFISGSVSGNTNVGGIAGSNAGGTINDTMNYAVITGTGSSNQDLGGITGSNNSNGFILSSYNNGTVTAGTSAANIGGVAGYNETANIINSYSTGTITAGSGSIAVGGLVGNNTGSSITDSYSSGLVSASGATDVGGLIGENSSSTITNSFWNTQTSGQSTSAGSTGAQGYKGMTTSQMETYANFDTPGDGFVTGSGWNITNSWNAYIAAPNTNLWFMYSDVANSATTFPMLLSEWSQEIYFPHQLELMGTAQAGYYTLEANLNMSSITNPADIWGTSESGNVITGAGFIPMAGFAGNFNGNGYVINGLVINEPATSQVGLFYYPDGNITNAVLDNVDVIGGEEVGALAGVNEGVITNSYSSGTVTGEGSTPDYIGGLVGDDFIGGVVNSASSATVTVTGAGAYLGGLVGINDAGGGYIINSYSTGPVIGLNSSDLGGLVGDNYGTIVNSYSMSPVTGGASSQNIGGLVGLLNGSVGGTIITSYSTGLITGGSTNVGGFVGDNTNGGTLTDNFFDDQVSNIGSTHGCGSSTSCAGVTGETTANMMTQSTYPSDWNFTTTWGINQTYPYLLAFYPSTGTAPRAITGSSSLTLGTTIKLAVNGAILDTTTANVNGSYYFLEGNNMVSLNNTAITNNTGVLVYTDSGATTGNAVTAAPASDGSITNFNLSNNTITVGSSQTSTVSNSDFVNAAGLLSDPYILYSVDGSGDITLGNSTYHPVNMTTTATTTFSQTANLQPFAGSSSNITFNGPLSIGATSVSLNGGTSGTIDIAGSVTGNNNALTIDNNDLSSIISGNIAGLSSLTKTGTGTLALSGTSTYSTATNVNSGTLNVESSGALGTSTATVGNGAILELTGTSLSLPNAFVLNNGSELLDNTSATNTNSISGGITLSNSASSSETIDVANVNETLNIKTIAIGGGSGTNTLTKSGNGTLLLSVGNTYSGATTISAGTIKSGAANALPSGTALSDSGTLDIDGNAQQVASISGGGTVTDSGAAATFTIANALADNFAGTLGSTNLSFAKSGAGTLTLSSANTYGGSTTINAGTIADGITNALPSTTALTDDGTLDLNSNSQQVASIIGTGNVTDSGTAGTFTVANTSADSYGGTISGTTLAFTKSGAGTLTLTNANSYSGITTISGGELQINNASGLGNTSGVSVGSGDTLNIDAVNITTAIPVTLTGGTLSGTGASAFAGAITLSSASTDNITSTSSTFTLNGNVNGAGNLTFNGPGSITLHDEIGTGTSLTSVTSNAGLTLSGTTIETTGNQIYNSPTTLDADSDYISTAGTLDFASTIDSESVADEFNLTTNSNGITTFGGAIGSTTPLASLNATASAIDLDTGTINTSGSQTYVSPIVLGASPMLSAGTTISLAGITGAQTLTLNATGGSSLNGIINIGSLSLNGGGTDTINTTAITTTGDQNYNDAVSLLTSPTIKSGSGSINFNDGLSGAGQTLTVQDNTAASTGEVSFIGDVTLAGLTTFGGLANYEVSLAGPGTDTITSAVNFLNTNGVALGGITLDISGSLTSTASTTTGLGGVTVNTSGNPIDLGNVSLTSTNPLVGTTSVLNSAGGAITIGTTNSSIAGLNSLTLTAGAGTINLTGAIGGSGILKNFSATDTGAGNNLTLANNISAATSINLSVGGTLSESTGILSTGLLTTTSVGGTTLNNNNAISSFDPTNTGSGNISLTNLNALTLTGFSQVATGNVTLSDSSSIAENAGVALTGALLTTSSTGGTALTSSNNNVSSFTASNSGTGNIALTDDTDLSTLTITGITQSGSGAVNVTDTGAMTNTGTVSSIGGGITLETLSPDTNERDLTINGDVTSGNVSTHGGAIDLEAANNSTGTATALIVNDPVSTASGTGGTLTIGGGLTLNATPTVGAGNLTLNGNGIDLTLGTVNFTSPVNFILTRFITVNGALTSGAGDNLLLEGDKNSHDIGGVYVSNTGSINSGGSLTIEGSNLAGLAGADPDAGIDLEGDVTASGAITLSGITGNSNIDINASLLADGAVTVTPAGTGQINLGANVSSQGGAIQFNAPVNLSTALAVDAGNGAITFGNAVNGAGEVLTVQDGTSSNGTVTFDGNVTLAGLDTFSQPYAVVFDGTSNAFTDAIQFLNTGGVTLGNSPADVFNFDGGLTHTTVGATTLDSMINTSGNPLDLNAVTLTGNSVLDAGAGAITLGALTGGFNLNSTSSSGTTLNGSVNIGSFTLGGGGTDAINNASITTSGTQTYNDALTLNVTPTFNGTTLTMNSAVGGAGGITLGSGTLTLNSSGDNYSGATTIDVGSKIVDGATNALPTGTALTDNGTLDLNGNSQQIASITGAGTGIVTDSGAAATFTLDNAAADTFNGTITGTNLSFTKSGAGTLTLNAASTYGGATTISAGTIADGTTNALPMGTALTDSGTLDLNGNSQQVASFTGSGIVTDSGAAGTFTLDNAAADPFNGTITGTDLSFTKSGAGLLTLNTANSYGGATTISAGTIADGITNALPMGTALTDNGTLDLNGNSQQVASITGTGIVTDSGAAGTFTIANASADPFNGTITGTDLSFTKSGAGTLTLNAASTYGGATTISAGTIADGTTNALPMGTALTDDGTLDLNGNSQQIASFTGVGVVTDSGAAGTFTLDNTAADPFNGTITGTNLSFTKSGAGLLTLNTANSYGGATTISAGTIADGITNALPMGTALTDNGTLDLNGNSQQIASITGAGTGIVTDSGAAATFTLDNAAADPFDGTITGTNLSFTKSGAGTLTLNAASTYGGATTISAGTIADGTTNALPMGTALTDDGTLDLNGNSQQIASFTGVGVVTDSGAAATFTLDNAAADPFDGTITGTDLSFTKSGAGLLTLNTGNTYGGATTISAGTIADGTTNALPIGTALTDNGTLDLNGNSQQVGSITGGGIVTDSGAAGTFTIANASADPFNGTITGTDLSFTKSGAGTLTLNSASTYGGATTISAGTIADDTIDALPMGTALADSGTLDLHGNSQQVASITGNGTVTDSGAAGTFTVDNAASDPFGGDLTGTDLSFTKSGAGTLTLSGDNSYGGGTNVSDGTLQINSNAGLSSSSAGGVISNGATLLLNGVTTSLSSITLDTGTISTNGTASLGGAISLTAGTSDTITANAGSNFTLNGTVNGAGELFINGAGAVTLAGNIGGGLTPPTFLDIGGLSNLIIDTSLIKTLNGQLYNIPVQLETGTTLDTTNVVLTFDNSITNFAATPENLTINTGSGDISLEAVGIAGNPIGNLQLNSTGNSTLSDPIYATSLTSSSGGETTIAGGIITTTAGQTYNNAVVLDSDTILTGTNIAVNDGASGGDSLSMNGDNLSLIGALALNNLTATGTGGNNSFTLNSGEPQDWTMNGTNAGGISTSGVGGTGSYNSIENVTGGGSTDIFTLTGGGTLSGNLNGGGGVNTLNGDNVSSTYMITGTNAGTATGIGGIFSNIENIHGGNADNNFTLAGGSLAGSINGGSGLDNSLTGGNSANTWGITGTDTGTVTGIGGTFSNFQNLTGGQGGNTFFFADNAMITGLVNGGSLGSINALNYVAYTTPIHVMMTALNTGEMYNDMNHVITNYINVNSLFGNRSLTNYLYLPTGTSVPFKVTYLGDLITGQINDPLNFNGFLIPGGVLPPSGIPPSFFTVYPIIQQPDPDPGNGYGNGYSYGEGYSYGNTNGDASVQEGPTLLVLDVNQNMDQMLQQLYNNMDQYLQNVKINPYCYQQSTN